MGFYKEWETIYSSCSDEHSFIEAFLRMEDDTVFPFYEGEYAELEAAFLVLNRESIDYLLNHLIGMTLRNQFFSYEIPCFSTFETGAVRVPELLEFTPEGISFKDLGYKLMKPTNKAACQKYGENQAKLSALLHLSVITNDKPQLVKETPLGHYLNSYTYESKKTLLKALLLQDDYIKYVIQRSLTNGYCYKDVVGILSRSTALRRRQNVRRLVTFLLEDSVFSSAKNNIDWEL